MFTLTAGPVCGARAGAELTIYHAAAGHAALLDWLASGTPLAIDLAAVEEADWAGMQLLLAARRAGAARGLEVRLDRISPAVAELAGLLRLERELGLAGEGA